MIHAILSNQPQTTLSKYCARLYRSSEKTRLSFLEKHTKSWERSILCSRSFIDTVQKRSFFSEFHQELKMTQCHNSHLLQYNSVNKNVFSFEWQSFNGLKLFIIVHFRIIITQIISNSLMHSLMLMWSLTVNFIKNFETREFHSVGQKHNIKVNGLCLMYCVAWELPIFDRAPNVHLV